MAAAKSQMNWKEYHSQQVHLFEVLQIRYTRSDEAKEFMEVNNIYIKSEAYPQVYKENMFT